MSQNDMKRLGKEELDKTVLTKYKHVGQSVGFELLFGTLIAEKL